MDKFDQLERDALEQYAKEELKKIGFSKEQIEEIEKKQELIRVYGQFLLDCK